MPNDFWRCSFLITKIKRKILEKHNISKRTKKELINEISIRNDYDNLGNIQQKSIELNDAILNYNYV